MSTCVRNYEKVGCYDEYHANVKDLVVYDRYGIKWNDIVGYMHHLACTCESKVRAANKERAVPEQYVGFALHFWGECYGRTQAHMDSLVSKSKSERCTGDQTYTKCFDKNPECTGHAFSEFVYKLKLGKGDIRMKRTCNETSVKIDCDPGSTVIIKGAYYGRRTPSICGAPLSEGWTNSCRDLKETSISSLFNSCFGKTSCTILGWASDPKDPCPSVNKYIDIYYFCHS
eukprot:gene14502-5562_t